MRDRKCKSTFGRYYVVVFVLALQWHPRVIERVLLLLLMKLRKFIAV